MYSRNSYKKFPELYDLLYQRYLGTASDFALLVESNTPVRGLILDLAAGTGEVSIPLLKKGFRVTSLDLNGGMLRQLKLKAEKSKIRDYNLKILDMKKLRFTERFDTVCVRQAVGYFVGKKTLETGFKKIFNSLKKGGKFIFNAPNYKGKKTYPSVYNIYRKGKLNAFVLETNKVNGRILKHKQYSIVWSDGRAPKFIADENSFYMFHKNEFESALKKSNFSKIDFSGSVKTLYCVAVK